MCLIVCAYRYHPHLPLVVAANRDEFHSRPSRAAHFWPLTPSQPELLAGQDVSLGGTWLGITRNGRFAAVTNIRAPGASSGVRSRGALTREFLLGKLAAPDYLESLLDSLDEYAGFNLLLSDRQGLFFLNSSAGRIEKLEPGIYGLSNSTLDSDWPKVRRSKAAVRDLLDNHEVVSTEQLTAIMLDRQQVPDHQLPDTGVAKELERLLSPSFIVNPQRDYGTRCTTAITVDQLGNVGFSEQNYGADSRVTSRRYFDFTLLDASRRVA